VRDLLSTASISVSRRESNFDLITFQAVYIFMSSTELPMMAEAVIASIKPGICKTCLFHSDNFENNAIDCF
jgi:hypothetical protein